MRIEVVHDVGASPDAVFAWVSDLERYPQWTNLLHRVTAERSPADSSRAWEVELRGKIGPFARSKRLRMVEVPTSIPRHARFERRELDGFDHGSWRLDIQVSPGATPSSTQVSAVFDYDGRLWSGAVERLLRDEIESSKRRLTELIIGASSS